MSGYRQRHRGALDAATVRIETKDASGKVIEHGTGILVTADWVLTCAHVVPPMGTPTVVYRGVEYPAEVLQRLPDRDGIKLYTFPDIALLKVGTPAEPLPQHTCVELEDREPGNRDDLYASGWPSIAGRPMWDTMSMKFDGQRGGEDADPLLYKTQDGQVQPGASGAGVVHLDSGKVVGIVKMTRDKTTNLGAVIVPMTTVFAKLAEFELPAKNQAAAPADEQASLEAHRRRLGWVLQAVLNELDAITEQPRRSMLKVLRVEPVGQVDINDLALELLGISLDDLRRALRALAEAQHEHRQAVYLLRATACWSSVRDKPWVAPDGAALLAAEREFPRPHVVHIDCATVRTVEMYVGRAALKPDWHTVAVKALDAETDPETGLPAGLLHSIRAELLANAGLPWENEDEVRRGWQTERSRNAALRQARELLLVLPAETGELDEDLLERLKAAFPAVLFAISSRQLSRGIAGSPLLLSVPAALDAENEEEAVATYTAIERQLEEVAGR
ncbi:serine protease [Streptomyces sp. NPDC001549]|uniref:S1 family peptidase n=1 Tax=Streptomyces sp. NPDC001549 TaxID=3364586 RepID=UPI0036B474DC